MKLDLRVCPLTLFLVVEVLLLNAFGLWRTRQEWGSDNAQTFRLYAYNDSAGIVNQSRREGQGIRCIKDTE